MKTVLAGVLLGLAAASTASAQSLLGESGASPYDPPKRAPFKKRDHLQIQIQDPAADAPARALTAEVLDIRPNGVLVVQAILRRKVNGDDELIRLTGEVAPEAVVQNAVRSEKLMNLSVGYEGRGAAGDAAKPGVVGWLFSKMWPF